MKKHNVRSALALLLCLLLGGALPHLLAAAQDAHSTGQLRPLPAQSAHYVYQGTLSNRALALSAHLNASPAVQRADDAPAVPPEGLWTALQSLLPLPQDATARAAAFTLAPLQYHAQYRYREVVYEGGGTQLTVFFDEESALPLRLELYASVDVLAAFLDAPGNESWSLLQRYASLLGLGELADNAFHRSSLIESHSMRVRGAPFVLTLTAMPAQGLLIFKLESE